MDEEDRADYITLTRSGPDARIWLVAVMRYSANANDHVMREVSDRLTYNGAVHLASQWSKDKGLEVRYIGRKR